jgi:fused signal recognition particle receptor
MAGFFKKLFNRITGRKEEEAPPPAVEQAQLPAPSPEPDPVVEDVVEVAIPPAPEPVIEAPVLNDPGPSKKIAPKPAPAKKAAKEPEPKAAAKKLVAKAKPDVKKPEPKKVEPKKPEPKKAEAKRSLAKTPVRPPAKTHPVKQEVRPEVQLEVRVEPKIVEAPQTPRVEVQPASPLPAPAPRVAPPPVEPKPVRVDPPAAAPAPLPDVPDEPAMRRSKPFAKDVPVAPVPAPAPEPERKGWFSRLKDGLSKSSQSITGSIAAIFTKRKLDATTLQELEDTLIQADLGITVSERIVKAVATGRYDKEIDPEEVKRILADEVAKVLRPVEVPFNFGTEKPYVILVVGVNGSGKTTTIGKLGAIAKGEDFKVKFAACDTFRAAAIEQLTVWGKRIGAETISRPQGADAAGLAFDAMKAAQEDGTDILFIDTAGRLHNKVYLMDELDKVVRVIKKYDAAAPHAVLLVLDATTGQNALAQAEAFTKVAGVTGLIMTKLDGTARGGILVAIAEKFKLPIHAIGVGETIDDLQPFDADAFARTIAGLEDA